MPEVMVIEEQKLLAAQMARRLVCGHPFFTYTTQLFTKDNFQFVIGSLGDKFIQGKISMHVLVAGLDDKVVFGPGHFGSLPIKYQIMWIERIDCGYDLVTLKIVEEEDNA